MTKMKAIRKAHPEIGLQMEMVEQPVLEHDEVLIKIHRSSICGTDLHIYKWDEWAQHNMKTPVTIGHEYSGEVVAIGDRVHHVSIGDRVSAEGHVVNLYSKNARRGHLHLDPHTKIIGVHRDGGFAEYVAVPAYNIIHLPDDISYDVGSILDPFGNAVQTSLFFDISTQDVLITGAGPIGMMAAAICTFVGARRVFLTGIKPYRLELAKKVAPKAIIINTEKENLKDYMKQYGIHEGFDVCLEMSGAEVAFHEILDLSNMGGKVAYLGLPSKPFEVDIAKLVFKSLNVKGIFGRLMFQTWQQSIALIQSGLDLKPLITHHFKADDYQEAFDLLLEGQGGKIILDWTD